MLSANTLLLEDLVVSREVYFQLLRFFIVFLVGILATKSILVPIVRKITSKRGDKKAIDSFENIAGVIGVFISFTFALQAANFGSLVTVLGAIAAAATVAIGFGMREQVSSVVAGIFIHMDNPFLKGDYIGVKDTEGVVKEINIRTTVVNGRNNEKQVIPNNILTGDVLKNYTKGNRTKVSINIKTSTKTLKEDEKEFINIIESMKEPLSNPEPGVSIKNVEKDDVECEVYFWMKYSEDVKEAKSKFLRRYSEYRSEKETEEDVQE